MLQGYPKRTSELLNERNLKPGDRVRIVRDDGLVVEGILMPRYEVIRRDVIIVKLDNGYNIGIRLDRIKTIIKVEGKTRLSKPGSPAPLVEDLKVSSDKKVFVIGTGGTIASRIDYETGAVKPYIDAAELIEAIPEAARYAQIYAEELFTVFSEDMKPYHWEKIIEHVAKVIEEGYDGIVIAHGTDTMGYTAAALSFAFHKGLPVPIVLVGAQRSSDRPSSDSAFNFTAAVLTAVNAPFAEVVVVMHGTLSDSYALAHRGTRVRKMHSSRRDAFQSINTTPLAKIWPENGRIEVLDQRYRKRKETSIVVENGFDDKVALIKHYPGRTSEIIDILVDKGFHGIVVEGTGFGHVDQEAIKSIERATQAGIPVVIATQTVFGRVNLNVYSTGRKMLKAGAIPVEDMIAETAYVKLSWALARTRDLEEVRRIMLTNLSWEIGERQSLRYYPTWYHDNL
ncbi:MAG: Glu-tRNA(Gln) amidotransferase subunit GatD [Desulfurococcales archaeon]|nr:Glu-tRNA(Gln) amidotransferase subunit GatD [Desulfurococcales archaeon]MEB3788396.1 Glu-tRNA(Gln) amidotransferase subunit GatD [Desulfurococcales archaeon]